MVTNKAATLFRPPQRRRIHEDVGEQLRDAILDARYRPGEKLPPERELAEEFRVNRTSIREAIKLLEASGLVTVRQGDGATVRPLIEASFDVLPFLVFRRGQIDARALFEIMEVMVPLLFEMARLALERHRPEQLDELRRLRAAVGDEAIEREDRFAAAREVLVLLSDMTQNRVWQMLARRARALLASEPLRQARARLRRDPGRLVPIMDKSLHAVEQGRPDEAVAALHELITLLRDSALGEGQGVRGEGRGARGEA